MGLELTRMTATQAVKWDEPAGATTPRGWLHVDGIVTGFYLDYESGHYRAPHAETLATVNGPRVRVWCTVDHKCRDCQPGNVLAVRYPNGPGTEPRGSRYVETVGQAREWVESGELAQTAAAVPTVRREQVSWSRWDADRMKTVTSHPWQYIVTEPDGYERCFDKRSQADAWIAGNYPQAVAVR